MPDNLDSSIKRNVYGVILIVLPLLIITDLPKIIENLVGCDCFEEIPSSGVSDVNNISITNSALEGQYLIASYNNAVNEIQNRIDQEHLLFVLKFTLVGAVFGVLFRKGIGVNDENIHPSLFCWAAVCISTIVDARMLVNVDIIQEHGRWINTIEQVVLTSGLHGWETFYSSSPLFNNELSSLLLMDRQLLTWVLYATTVYVFVVKKRGELSTHAGPFLLCFVLFGFLGLHFYFRFSNGLQVFIPLFVIVVLAAWYLFSALLPKESTDTSELGQSSKSSE